MVVFDLNIIIESENRKPILADLIYNNSVESAPLIIFCHGYKGFKDWGAWPLLCESLAMSGFSVLKFNFSHNGGTCGQPIDFPDLEAFGNNNYTIELEDLDRVMCWSEKNYSSHSNINPSEITLLGHSRGGGIVTIKAAEDTRVKNVISLAGVSDFETRFPTGIELNAWKKTGVRFVQNGRTKQQMPHYYQFFNDFLTNQSRLTIQRAVENLRVPFLIIHGDEDTSVSVNEALALHSWSSKSQLVIIKGANHVFGSSHPWKLNNIPPHFHQIHNEIIDFINN